MEETTEGEEGEDADGDAFDEDAPTPVSALDEPLKDEDVNPNGIR